MDRELTSVDLLENLYRELAKCPAIPELINHLVDNIEEQFEKVKAEVEHGNLDQLAKLMEVHAETKEKLVEKLIHLNQELCDSGKFRLVGKKYLDNT